MEELTNRKEKIKEMEAILEELKKSEQETSASIALNHRESHHRARKMGSLSTIFKLWKLKYVLLLALCAIIIGATSIGVYTWISGTSFKQSEASFIEQIHEMNSLATAQGFVKTVIEQEDNKLFGKEISADLPGTKRKLLLVVPGTVLAGVNLDRVEADDIALDEKEKTLSLTLPKAEILQSPSIDTENIKAFSVEGLFRSEVDWEEGYQLATEAKDMIELEAIDQGILQAAETSAKDSLTSFFDQLGYKVTITFE